MYDIKNEYKIEERKTYSYKAKENKIYSQTHMTLEMSF